MSSTTSTMEMVLRTEKQKFLRGKNEKTAANVLIAKENIMKEKMRNSSCLRESLLHSTLRSNKLLEEETIMRNILKESTRCCGDQSSTLVRGLQQ